MIYVIAANPAWYKHMEDRLSASTGHTFVLLDKREDLTITRLRELQPRYVFFPHWSHIIPDEIHNSFECVIFHMTDVPFGRGGSPLQNLIARGIYDTKISALRCEAGLDAGPVYMKRPLALYGNAEEIYLRAACVVEEMILEIVRNEPMPVNQKGEAVYFPRRKPEDGNLSKLATLEQVFDYIRMLDAEGYPKAFVETDNFRFEFCRAAFKHGKILADVVITKKAQHAS